LLGSLLCQFSGSSWAWSTMASMSEASARVTTSASRPSITARACLPEPPCEAFTVTLSPVFAFQSAMKAWSNSA
jgi:hypothetical protein